MNKTDEADSKIQNKKDDFPMSIIPLKKPNVMGFQRGPGVQVPLELR